MLGDAECRAHGALPPRDRTRVLSIETENPVFRERQDGTIERVWPHNGLARLRLTRTQVEQVLRHHYPYWTKAKLERALAHPWRFKRDINWALTQILEQRLVELGRSDP